MTRSFHDALPPRPAGADGTFLRILALCDTYTMEHYPRVRTAALAAKLMAEADPQGCVTVTVHSGDFLSPNQLTSVDLGDTSLFSSPLRQDDYLILSLPAGKSMLEGLNLIPVDFVCFGNHEFDLPEPVLQKRIREFKVWLGHCTRFPLPIYPFTCARPARPSHITGRKVPSP